MVMVVALIVIGPQRLPAAARQAGQWYRQTKRVLAHFSAEVNRQLEAEQLRDELKKQTSAGVLEKELTSFNKAISHSLSGKSIGNAEPQLSTQPCIANSPEHDESRPSA